MTQNQTPEDRGTPKTRTIHVEVRKKRRVNSRSVPTPTRAPKSASEERVKGESAADKQPSSADAPRGTAPSAAPDHNPETVAFQPLENVPYEPAPWQSVNLLKKKGVTLLVTAPGACSFALPAYFGAFLSGRGMVPFGAAHYPGDVLFTTHTPDLDRAMRAAVSSLFPSEKKVLTRCTPRRFNWKEPITVLEQALAGQPRGATAAVIIDAGPFPQGLRDDCVDAAVEAMNKVAEEADCLVLVVVESTNRSVDPFERIPKALRGVRGTLLAVPLRSKTLAPQAGAPAEFMLMRLAQASPHSLNVRFFLVPAVDLVETTSITWGVVGYGDPREAFRMAESIDLTVAQRAAVELAVDIIRHHGPTSSRELQAAGKLHRGIAPTTMRDALSVAKLLGYLGAGRSFDGRSFWIIPGVTQIPSWMYLPNNLRDGDIPF
ncbi:hypothetical protein WG922_21230 [Ramlibacter sp. AN1015]|uniref:hypothetical protein n=1 Tax=Ramlibacter sp. AN1015 TaxID=3133428 RepID=UPI0030C34B27